MEDKFEGVDLGAALDAALQRVRQGETVIGQHDQRIREAEAVMVSQMNERDRAIAELRDAWADLGEVLDAAAKRSHVQGGVLGGLLSQPRAAD